MELKPQYRMVKSVLEPPFRPEFVEDMLKQDRRIKTGKEKIFRANSLKDIL